jgi:micrococcal nuclease
MAASTAPELVKPISITGALIIVFSIVYQLAGWTFLNTPTKGGVPATIGTYYKVTKVTDGDTLHIDLDGTDERVRLIGINTPETVDPRTSVQCFGKEASDRMKDLAGGKNVRLEYDDSQSLRDTYGRLLAYVYLEDGEMLNRKMIAEGYAYEYTYLTPYKYQSEFRQLQNLARTSGRGLWGTDTCNGIK